jgi:large subunit ribosomal protein L13
MEKKTYTIHAEGKRIGRIASEAAKILMGKQSASYAANKVADVSVSIVNVSKADISEKKKSEKTYARYSGYPGGLKVPTMKRVIAKKGYSEIFRMAVKGMLPKNKLAPRMMKNLKITE